MPVRPSDFDLAPDPAAFLLHPGYGGLGASGLTSHAGLSAEQRDLLVRASQLANQGNVQAAIHLLEETLRLQPQNALTWFALGWYYAKRSNLKKSANCYRKGLELDASNKVAWNNLGHALRHLRRWRESEESLRRSVAVDPSYATAWMNLGITLKARRKFSDAAAAFTQTVDLNPADASGWYWLGFCRLQLKDYKGAVDALQRATAIDPEDWDAWISLGDSLKKLGHAAEARSAYAKAGGFVPPPPTLGWEVYCSASVALAASFGAPYAPYAGVLAVMAFVVLIWKMKLGRVQLFLVAGAALPLLATQFLDTPAAAPICMGILLIWSAILGKVWGRMKD